MDHEQKEQRNFEIALFFLSLQISREYVTMEARKDFGGGALTVGRYMKWMP